MHQGTMTQINPLDQGWQDSNRQIDKSRHRQTCPPSKRPFHQPSRLSLPYIAAILLLYCMEDPFILIKSIFFESVPEPTDSFSFPPS